MSNLNSHPVRRTAAGVLASALAFSGAFAAAPAFAAPGFTLERLSGADRYATSAAIAAQFGSADGAILASGEAGHIVDALSASFLAGVREDPVLLTARGQVSAAVLAQLNNLTSKNVTIVGGEMAVSEAVATQLRNAGFTVTRLSGANRYETSEAIIRAAQAAASPVGILVSGQSPVDALAAGALAYEGDHPVFLTAGGTIPESTLDAMQAAGTQRVIIVGGTTVVPESVRAQLTARNISVVTRLGGVDRSATSRMVADYLIENMGFSATTFNVASGANNGVDALSGAALSGKNNTVLLVTNTATNPGSVDDFATARAQTLTTTGRIFGGESVVAPAVETQIETAGGGGTGTPTGAAATTRPELLRAEVVSTNTTTQTGADGTTVRYVFDEEVTGTTAPDAAEFHVYSQDGTQLAATGLTVVIESGGSSVTILYPTLDTAAEAAALTLATVDDNAVTDNEGQTNPTGDAALGSAGGTTVTYQPGVTAAPDLLSVTNLSRQDPANPATNTLVDFVFDEAAFVVNGNEFDLISVNGDEIECAVANATATTVGTTTITASCENTQLTGIIDAADVARGTIEVDAVSDNNPLTGATEGDDRGNALQATNNPDANSSEPDLASAELRFNAVQTSATTDTVVFDFDEAVLIADDTDTDTTGPDTDTDGSGEGDFFVYDDQGDMTVATSVARSMSDASVIIATFQDTEIDDAVGASVLEDAVRAQTGSTVRTNEIDEVGVNNSRSVSDARTPGRTDDPDLLSAAVRNNATTGGAEVVYTFDEGLDRDAADVVDGDFRLVQADGTRLVCTDGNAAVGNTNETDATVVCTEFAFAAADGTATGVMASSAQVRAAVLATVDDDAVFAETTGATAAADGNPEGAALVTGTTGTSAS